MSQIKGPALCLLQYLSDEPPFNTLENVTAWAKSLGYLGVQLPAWDKRVIDLNKATESKDYCDELRGQCHGLAITELTTHLYGQLIADIKDKAKVIQGDLTVWSEVMNVVKENNVQGIFHLGAMLSETSESNPWASFQSNVLGTMHVLEAARLFGIKRVVFSSAVATFGPGRASDVITDETLQRPTTMYGIGKLFGELLGRFYRRRFDLDFRCLRYCAVIGPGAKSKALAQYNAWMIESATLGKAFECYVSEDTAIPVTYFKDAIRAAETLYDAPKEKIKTVCYNISGVSPVQTAKELELAIKKLIPEAKITYKPNALATEFIKGLNIKVIDDSRAREEWGWQPLYSNLNDVVADFINEVRTKPQFYGLT